jgi:glycerate kinase
MRILIASDKFKGTLKFIEVAKAIDRGIKRVLPGAQTCLFPMADGGEGTVDALVSAMGDQVLYCEVTGPLGKTVKAYFGLLPFSSLAYPVCPECSREKCSRRRVLLAPSKLEGGAVEGIHRPSKIVIEMSAASGLHLIPPEKLNPLLTTTYGTGELIKATLDYDPVEIIIGIGGSGTVDGGMGMAQALGVKFFDEKRYELGFGGRELEKISHIDISGLDGRIGKTSVLVASDVKNPLFGPSGAAYVYGPQKGATPEMVKRLDSGLRNYAKVINDEFGKDVRNVSGAGAAGGLGAGLIAFLNARLEPGIELVIRATDLKNRLKEADLVITGEGKIDAQTAFGKVPVGVAELAKEKNIPVYAICGQKGEGADDVYKHGIGKIFSILDIAKSLEDACKNTAYYVELISEKLAKEL